MIIQSFGAGVQSTALLYLAIEGHIAPPDYCIFSDTGWEPPAVYEHLQRCKEAMARAGIEYREVSAGSIRDDLEAAINGAGRAENPPFFSDGGMLFRKCTRHYKARPLDREVAAIREARGVERITQRFGISLDEMQRMRDPHKKWIDYDYPLIDDLQWTRAHCLEYLRGLGIDAPKSACVCCPYRSDRAWQDLRADDPQSWQEAVDLDRRIRPGVAGARGPITLHRSGLALDVAVDRLDAQGDLFGRYGFNNEREGHCGV